MSQPLRFKPVNPAHEMVFSPEGGWVAWEDYQELQAEVERLEANTTKLCTHGDAEIARLKAEVERLTKAGDAMASSIQFNEEMAKDYNGPTIVHQSVQRWNAAKEGKQP